MKTDWVTILANLIFISIVVTLVLAVASYFAYKLREARRPRSASELRREGEKKVFFEAYVPHASGNAPAGTTAASKRA